MLECLVVQFIMGYNPHTTEIKKLYRCQNEKKFKYLQSGKVVRGVYSIDLNVIILEERYGV